MQEIFKAIKNFDTGYPKPENTCPYGSGNSAEKIVEILKKSYAKEKLSRL
jgi:UDP-N-acetylglucosamine 2-epimerase